MTGYTDKPGKVDMLGMDCRCAGIAEFIRTCSTPMTVAIEGDWGTGKTTAMNLIMEKLNCPDHCIWFNSWQFSVFGGGESLIFDLLSMMLERIRQLMHKPEDTVQENRIKAGASAAAKGAWAVSTAFVKQKAEVLFDIVEQLGEMSDHKERDGAPQSKVHYVSELRDKVQEHIDELLAQEGQGARLYVFLDDLDRLDPKFAVELMEGLKILADYDRCVFVLAVDQEVVVRGLRSKYGNEFDEIKASKFFDKIIQVPFNLPVDSYDMRAFLRELLGNGAESETEGYARLLEIFGIKNPRTIKRSLNMLQLYECISRAGGGADMSSSQEKLRQYALLLLQMEEKDTCVGVLDIIRRHSVTGNEYNYEEIAGGLKKLTEEFDDSAGNINKRALAAVLDLFSEDENDIPGVKLFVNHMLQTQEIVGDQEEWTADLPKLTVTRQLFDFLDQRICAEIKGTEYWSNLRETLERGDKELLTQDTHIYMKVRFGEKGLLFTRDKKGYPNLSVYGCTDTQALEGIEDHFFLGNRNRYEGGKYCYFYVGAKQRLTIAGMRFVQEDTLERFLDNCGLTAQEEPAPEISD